MEVVDATSTASQVAPEEDVISSMPDIVISNILDRLPIQEAVRTGILSKEWRYKWKILSQLDFDMDFHRFLQDKGKEMYYKRIISRMLLLLKGSIKKFSLCIVEECHSVMDAEDINNWIIFLTENGLKQLTLIYVDPPVQRLRLTSHIFSCRELTHMELYHCSLHPTSDFYGFPNLVHLDLASVWFEETYTCGKFLSRCPNLEILGLHFFTRVEELELAQLVKLRELSLDLPYCEFLADAKRSVLTALPCLEKLALYNVDFKSKIMVSFALELIRSSPNLRSLTIIAERSNAVPASEIDYSRMGQLKLQKVQLCVITGLKQEEYFIKSLLACSPLLKTMVIESYSRHGESDFAMKLLKLHRASPIAEIDLVQGLSWCPNLEILGLHFFTRVEELELAQLVKLRELSLDLPYCEFLADAKRSVLTALPCLEKLALYNVDFKSKIMVSFALELIQSSPNLRSLTIIAERSNAVPASEIDYSRMGQLKLQKVQLCVITGLKQEEYFIKSLLACSPLLKTMVIESYSRHGESDFAMKLLKLHRASPIAEIDLVQGLSWSPLWG
ncbi:F-box domain, FBD domain, Leucine-rich repeat domain, L domain-like protein [Artemisia annua]|uniref:F-box domain, FBD domain, Leucine-rich repeat domain, L domain-like protein n=1 Tax=Artemisia annua TaxID=35608 RepID=A0A2U1KW57_ARTAN|nr:F-box domain, FBD domain, Leucine-rich repeat domain, L domain-like protein [Artemisia annua]